MYVCWESRVPTNNQEGDDLNPRNVGKRIRRRLIVAFYSYIVIHIQKLIAIAFFATYFLFPEILIHDI